MKISRRRRYTKFKIPAPDCKAIFGKLIIEIYGVGKKKQRITYNISHEHVHQDIIKTIDLWLKFGKFADLPLQEYLHSVLKISDYKNLIDD